MEIANSGVASVGHDEKTYLPMPGSECVFDVPNDLGMTLIGQPHHGWRWPGPGDWAGGRLEYVDPARPETLPAGRPEAVDGRRAPLRPADGTDPGGGETPAADGSDAPAAGLDAVVEQPPPPADETTVDAAGDPTSPDPAAAPDAVTPVPVEPAPKAATLPDQILDLVDDAGDTGLTRAAAKEALGEAAYAAIDRMVSDGRLVRAGRGLYKRPTT